MPAAKGSNPTLVAVTTEDRLKTLERLRDRIAEAIDDTDSGAVLERLAARLQHVLAEIDELLPADAPCAADAIAAKRAARRKAAGLG